MTIKLDTANAQRDFNAAVTVMGQLTGFDRKKIVMGEAASVLKTCASRTWVQSDESAMKAGQLEALVHLDLTGRPNGSDGNVTVNAGIKGPYGRVFARRYPGAKFKRVYDAGFQPIGKMTASLMQIVSTAQTEVQKIVGKVQKSRGLARGAWVRIAQSLNLYLPSYPGPALSSSAYNQALKAEVKGGKQVNNGASQTEDSQRGFAVTIINRLPYGRKIGMDRLLATAIAGRAAYFHQSISKGFNGSLEQITKRFRGWTVTGKN